jgi:uncharacterized protein YjiK
MTTELTVRDVFDLQLREVSGICERAAGDERPRQLLAIGDDSHLLLVGDLEPEVPASFARHDLEPVLAGAGVRTGDSSQWEGIDTDETGRVFVLREVPGTVFVFDPSLRRLLHVLHLTVEDDPTERRAWEADENALGEGLLLLRNGHLFVVKEEKPRQLLEFGPGGEQAQGLHRDLLIVDTGRFPTPDEQAVSFSMLSSWDLGGEALERVGDLSDVTIGPDGRVYLLSDESRCVARLQERVPPESGTVAVDRIWGLPERLHQPEGLVITAAWDVLVATDHEERRDNLYLLDGLGP